MFVEVRTFLSADFFANQKSMPQSIPVTQKKRGRPRTGITPQLGVRFPPELIAEIDAWIARQSPKKLSRSEAIRVLVEGALKADVVVYGPDGTVALIEMKSRKETEA